MIKYIYKKTVISLNYIQEIIYILEKKKNKINKLKQASYFVENQVL